MGKRDDEDRRYEKIKPLTASLQEYSSTALLLYRPEAYIVFGWG